MAVIAQRNGVRVVAFQKCGHTSIINMFLTPADMPLVRGTAPALRSDDAYRGYAEDTQDWPEPELTLAFFRNPLIRALSAYEQFIVRGIQRPLASPVISFGDDHVVAPGVPSLGRQSFTDLGFTADMEFKDFCLHLRNIDLNADNHLKPQATSYMQAYGNPGQVYSGQLEQLDITWPLLVDQYGLNCTKEVPQYNAAKYETKDRLTGVHLDLFKKLYAQDYRFWEASHFEARAPLSSVCH